MNFHEKLDKNKTKEKNFFVCFAMRFHTPWTIFRFVIFVSSFLFVYRKHFFFLSFIHCYSFVAQTNANRKPKIPRERISVHACRFDENERAKIKRKQHFYDLQNCLHGFCAISRIIFMFALRWKPFMMADFTSNGMFILCVFLSFFFLLIYIWPFHSPRS